MSLYDRVRAVTGTIGTGPVAMAGAVSGYRPFSVVADGDTVSYVIEDGTAWETGHGVWDAETSTLTRSLVTSSTGSLLGLSGAANAYITPHAADFFLSSNPNLSGVVSIAGSLSMTGGATIGGSSSVVGEMKATYFLVPNGQGYFFGVGDGTTWLKGAGTPTPYLSFGTNNSEVMRLLGANLGIGTATPAAKLHSVSPDGSNPFGVSGTTKGLRVETSAIGTTIRGVDHTLSTSYQPLVLGGSYLAFETNGTAEAMRIMSAGQVGIGTTNPLGKLTVANAGKSMEFFPGYSSVTNRTQHYDRTALAYLAHTEDASEHLWLTSNAERMRLAASGKLGIGTASPSELLDVHINVASHLGNAIKVSSDASQLGKGAGIVFHSTNPVAPIVGNSGRIYSAFDGLNFGDGRLTLQTPTNVDEWVDTLTVKNGAVGIGTTTPDTLLKIVGPSPRFRIRNTASSNKEWDLFLTGTDLTVQEVGVDNSMTFHTGGGVSMNRLPTHADNAAAVTAGLATHRLYKTSAGDLRIVV